MSASAGPPGARALSLWEEKLDFLLEEEAIAADPALKFNVRKQIEEARQKIRELTTPRPREPEFLPRLHQLPFPPADFTGRKEDLAALRVALTAGGATAILGLRGMGGVGKTALALKLAHEVAPQYPDAQIYLDLQGVTTPLAPSQAMAHVIRSLHPEAKLPEEDIGLVAVYRFVLHGKGVLLLMLAQLCGGLPLALRLAGSALADRTDSSPAVYAKRLAAGRERLEPVEASLGVSFALLSVELRKLWRLLAVFPGTFDATAAAAVWEQDDAAADGALGNLVTSSLLQWEEGVSRYRLHDLARRFAGRQLDEAEKAAARRRHSAHYLEILRRANSLYKQGGEGVLDGLRLFDAEWGNLQAGQEWAASQPPEDAAATALCSAYPNAGSFCLGLRLPQREQIRWRQAALAAARREGDRRAEALHLGGLGIAYKNLGETRRAIKLFEQDLAITREIGDRGLEGVALGNMGIAYADLGEPRRAIELFEQDLAIAREIGDRRGEGAAVGNLGLAYSDLGEPRRAIELFELHLAIARETGDRRGEGNVVGNLGLAYAAVGETDRAIELYEQQLAITREIGDRWGEAMASWNLGEVYEKQGDLARAADLLQVMVDLEREVRHANAEKDAARVNAIRARLTKSGSPAEGGQ